MKYNNLENWAQDNGYFIAEINGVYFVSSEPVTSKLNEYAVHLSEIYDVHLPKIIDFVIKDIASFYQKRGFSDKYIRENLGVPQIRIFDDGGEICWLNNKLDEHIVICEFVNDFVLCSTYIDG